jgi:FixJ family two-component response regulator
MRLIRRVVFVVDDDQSARSGFARLLRTAGYDVREFRTAREFVDALEPDSTGCVLLDSSTPGITSEDLQTELRARNADLTVICVTPDDGLGSRQIAEELQAVAYFRKPIDGMALLDAIAWAMRDAGHQG